MPFEKQKKEKLGVVLSDQFSLFITRWTDDFFRSRNSKGIERMTSQNLKNFWEKNELILETFKKGLNWTKRHLKPNTLRSQN
jgi:hypothetical protein